MKRIITAFLAVVLVFSIVVLASCAEKDNQNQNNTNQGNDRTFLDNIPDDVDFADAAENERRVTFVYVEGTNGTFTQRSIAIEEITGDTVDTKIYERNKTIQNRFGIEIESVCASASISGLQSSINPVLQAGDPDYDIIAGYQ